jgi:hypothetical protein
MVGYRPFIQISVVLYGAEFTVLFPNKKEATGIGGIESSDPLQSKIFGEEFPLLFFFFGRQGIDMAINRCRGIWF